MTYGEKLYYLRKNLKLKDIEKLIDKLPKRMPKSETLRYYNKKLKKAFEEGKKVWILKILQKLQKSW